MTTVVTKATGGDAKPVGVLYIETELQVSDDLLSACLAHERAIWELHLDMEIGPLHVVNDLLRRFEGIEPEELLRDRRDETEGENPVPDLRAAAPV